MTEKEKIGNLVRRIRDSIPSKEYPGKFVSQQELSDSNDGITKQIVGTIERGEANPTLEKMIFLAKSLNMKKVTIFDVEINIEKFIKELKE